jgi:hypothetical protein
MGVESLNGLMGNVIRVNIKKASVKVKDNSHLKTERSIADNGEKASNMEAASLP